MCSNLHMSEYLDILLILFSLLHASSFLLSDVAGIVAGVLGEGSTDGSPAAVQAKIGEDVEVIGQYGGFPMKLTKSWSQTETPLTPCLDENGNAVNWGQGRGGTDHSGGGGGGHGKCNKCAF